MSERPKKPTFEQLRYEATSALVEATLAVQRARDEGELVRALELAARLPGYMRATIGGGIAGVAPHLNAAGERLERVRRASSASIPPPAAEAFRSASAKLAKKDPP